ncbi:hypothetical protein FQR65_LT16676 [Abscondita terminalis]|nr:hypothetical protein FQR65_LT16676 [Abscondita terminalis]
MRQTRKLLSLSEIVPLNQNVTTYKSVYGTDENNIIGYSLSNVIDGNYIEDESFDKFNKIIKKGGLESLFQRFIALENMKDAQKNLDKIKDLKLFIKYDVQHVASQDFSINEIVLKIKKTKLIKKNICLYFNDETEIQNIEILEKNIQQLKKMGILIGYRMKLNSDFNIKVFGIFKPDYVIVYGKTIIELSSNSKAKDLREFCEKLHAADIAEAINEMEDNRIRIITLRLLPNELASDTFTYIHKDIQEEIIKDMSNNDVKNLFDEIFTDDIVDILEELPSNMVRRILKVSTQEEREKINEILQYEMTSVEGIMSLLYKAKEKAIFRRI